jgi:hypothetical protein
MPRAPDPCRRNAKGFCDVIHDVSIDEDVLFFVFPHSRFGNELTLETGISAQGVRWPRLNSNGRHSVSHRRMG